MDIKEKAERFDINCTIDTGDQVDVEMHSTMINESGEKRANFLNKYTYYMTDLHSSQKSKGKEYSELVRTYQVTFCSHSVFNDQVDFVSRFAMRTETGILVVDQINMIIVELSKLNDALKKPVEKLTTFEKWSLFFKYAQEPVQRKHINDIIREKEEIGMAAELLQEISKDERERAILRSRRMAETDLFSNLRTAEKVGEAREREKWQVVVADMGAKLVDRDAKLADKDAKLADKDAELAQLRSQIAELQKNAKDAK